MEALLPYLPTDRRHALARGELLPERASGAALFVDISGFTPLAEALARELGPQRGAEELTQHLNRIYDALITKLDRFRGSVIGFSGDAATSWFDGDDGLIATACALEMHRTMEQFSTIGVASGEEFQLTVKAGVAAGAARRFLVGDPQWQVFDVLAGRLLDDMAAAEHQGKGGEVVLADSAMRAVGARVRVRALRADGSRYGVADQLGVSVEPIPWPDLPPEVLTDEQLRPWLLAPVYERLHSGQGEFLTELRPAVALFVRFAGIDYDGDDLAGAKLDEFIRRVQRVLAAYEGTLVDITTGDKGSYLYLAFGAPVAHEDDVERAASTALKVRAVAADLPYISSVQLGINRGRMRIGAYGGRTRRTYGVLGDATNLAARLMTAAEPGEILISKSTFDSIDQTFTSVARAAITVKGKAEPIEVVSLTGRHDRSAQDRAARRHLLPMVGREPEMAIIQDKIGKALEGRGQLVGITAEAGMGKSRLVAEARRAARSRRFSVYAGECKSYGMHASYLVWSGIWRSILQVDADLSAEDQIAALEASVGELEPALLERVPLLGPLLNLAIPDNNLTQQFDPQFRKVSLERMLAGLLRSVARKKSLLIVLEDTHWIDPLSEDLLKVLGSSLADSPVLLLLAYRTGRAGEGVAPAMASWPHFTPIALAELNPEQAKQWIEVKSTQLYGPDVRPPHAFVERLLARAEGNPFYIEEVLNYLRDHSISPRDAKALSGIDLPASLDSLVLTRIDQLAERPRSTLRVASVFGRTFNPGHLLGAHPELDGDRGIQTELEELNRKGFVEQEAGDSYSFKHGVIQEAAYGSLPFGMRRDLHGSVAGFLERTYADAIDSAIDLLAFHYFRGESWPKALEFNLMSARQAQSEYSNAAAISAAENVLEAAGHLELDHELRSGVMSAHQVLGDVLGWEARYPESVEAFRKAIDVARGWEDLFSESRAWYGLAEAQMHKGEFREAIASAENAEHISRAAELKMAPIKSRWIQAWGTYRLGEIERAEYLARPLIDLSLALGDRAQHAENLNLLGTLGWASGRYDEAQRSFTEAYGIFQELNDGRRAMSLTNNLGLIAESKGDFTDAAKRYTEALTAARQIGYQDGEIAFLGNLGRVKVMQGDFVGGEADLRAALDITEEGGTDIQSEALSALAEAKLGQGRLDDALGNGREALDVAVRMESRDDLARAWRVLGMVISRLREPPILERSPFGPGRAVDAHACFSEAARIFRELRRQDELARTLRLWAKHEYDSGDQGQASEKWKEARGLYEKLGAVSEVNRMGELK